MTDETERTWSIHGIRHVIPDRGDIHLVTTSDEDTALCGQSVVGLRPFGDPPETFKDAARLGMFVNAREDVCDDCRKKFNDNLY